MKNESILLSQSNDLAEDYVKAKETAIDFFEYAPYEMASYHARLTYLKSRPFAHRNELVNGLMAYNREIGNHSYALERIDTLRQKDTVVVIGGQQAGILTGPLYSIHKAISLLQTARRMQEELGVQVVPVFWIAGEDHDLDEINHTYLLSGEGRLVKKKLSTEKAGKVSASQFAFDQEQIDKLIHQFFAEQLETPYTESLRMEVKKAAEQSETLVDWFARIMAHLFGKHGLVLVESSSDYIRALEKPVFHSVVTSSEAIQDLLLAASDKLERNGYPQQIQLDEKQANLFVYHNGERLLLYREGEQFFTKHRELVMTRTELLRRIDQDPTQFSTNVVSRPMAQEHIFPTLAFIGGPGEIAYWSYFKAYFEKLGYQLPIVLPRTSISLVAGAIERCMEQFNLTVSQVISGYSEWKANFLNSLVDANLTEQFAQARQEMLSYYRPLVEQVGRLDQGLEELALTNLKRIEREIHFLETRSKQAQIDKHQIRLKRLERIETSLLPEGKLQERMLNLFVFMNLYGPDLVDRLVAAEFSFDATHKVFYLS
ncbi:bacillithiol biosynthesis cysteine-adding enzyme BshC [Brevibacillus ginsengisoli]|uniref:bacillithiol biosynthesis cysteine-adding enzyme BshC n=1 Tax=Brevibacillus ginsengisoli TaxID=363854 RepID=UPI003CF686E9